MHYLRPEGLRGLLVPDDKSYRQAKALVDNGDLGEIHAVETTGIDQADPNGMFLT